MSTGTSCGFCRIAQGEAPSYVVREDDATIAFLDARPVFHGHCLVTPRAHHETLADLPHGLIEPLFAAVRALSSAVPGALGADGTFVAVNNKVSQSVPHLHVHVVPRRFKDGLRGFFWPRQAYTDERHAARVQAAIRGALAAAEENAGLK